MKKRNMLFQCLQSVKLYDRQVSDVALIILLVLVYLVY